MSTDSNPTPTTSAKRLKFNSAGETWPQSDGVFYIRRSEQEAELPLQADGADNDLGINGGSNLNIHATSRMSRRGDRRRAEEKSVRARSRTNRVARRRAFFHLPEGS